MRESTRSNTPTKGNSTTVLKMLNPVEYRPTATGTSGKVSLPSRITATPGSPPKKPMPHFRISIDTKNSGSIIATPMKLNEMWA